MTDLEIISVLITTEGGFTNNPDDHGGPTKYGITIPDLAAFRGVDPSTLSATDIENLTTDEATAVFQKMYIKDPHFDAIQDDHLRALMVDCGVLHGVETAVKWLQNALGVSADGNLGPITQMSLTHANPQHLQCAVCATRIRYMADILRNPTQDQFEHGWLDRAANFVETIA